MKKLFLVCLVLVGVDVHAQSVKIGWDQSAPDLNTVLNYKYALGIDGGAPTPLVSTCSVGTPYSCTAPITVAAGLRAFALNVTATPADGICWTDATKTTRASCTTTGRFMVTVPQIGTIPLVAWWKLDDVSGPTAADSSGANLGMLVGPPTWVSGTLGGALAFDGADYVRASSLALNNLSPLSLSAMVKATTTNNGRILAKEEGAGTGRWALIVTGAGGISFFRDFATTELRRTTTDGVLPLGAWRHVVATWDGSANASGVHLYVNGVEASYSVNQNGVGAKTSDAAMGVFIGNRGQGDRTFDGVIDDARLYNRALTSADIAAIYADPCVAQPLTVTSISWPGLGTGSRQMSFTVAGPAGLASFTVTGPPETAVFVDTRKCAATVQKP